MKKLRFLRLLAGVMVCIGAAGFTMQTVDAQSSPSFRLPCVTNVPYLPDGTPVHIDLPARRHRKNTGGMGRGGPGTGSGLCVFTSIMMGADWHHIPTFNTAFQEWMTHKEGGGWPEKLLKMMREFAAEKKIDMPELVQNVDGDMDMLADAIQHGYLPGCTYCKSPTGRYNGQLINHMLNPVAARAKTKDGRIVWCVQDNNYPGTWEWMEEKDFAFAFKQNGGKWAAYIIAPEPPPIPKNMEK